MGPVPHERFQRPDCFRASKHFAGPAKPAQSELSLPELPLESVARPRGAEYSTYPVRFGCAAGTGFVEAISTTGGDEWWGGVRSQETDGAVWGA